MTIWVSFTPLWACICFATCWLPYRKRYYIVSRWNVFTIWLLKSICGIRYQVKGMENLPDEIVVDVTTLGLGKSIFVGDLKYDHITILTPATTAICAVKMTRAAGGASAAAEAAAAAKK